jgi:short-subunit dehydrogenase
MAARIGIRNEAVYSASKHGVYGVSEGVRHELRGTGVELTVVMPGLVRTELAAGTLQGSVVLSPRDVGTAIAGALERPRFDLYIPRHFGALDGLVRPLPRPAREAILRALGTERNTAATTGSDRAAYERRVEAQGRSGADRLEDLHRDL